MKAVARGDVLKGRYGIDALLGEGGMGQVWLGHDRQLGRDVAIKVFAPHMMSRPDSIARLEREARVGAALGHAHIVHTFDFGEHEGRWFLVMQLVVGENLLAHRQREEPLPPARIFAFGCQLADAFVATHAIGLVHRDLKPENVLVEHTPEGPLLRVADFGMAYVMESADPKQGRITHDGLLGGTPEYMSPEQIHNDVPVGPPTDIYALGCVLYELAMSRTPFEKAGVGTIFASHLYAPPPMVDREDLPSGFAELVDRMLSKLPADRPTAEAVRRRLALLDPKSAAYARYGGVVSDRAARMIEESPRSVVESEVGTRVEVIGALELETRIALAAGGLAVVTDRPDVRFVVGASLEQIAHLCADTVPVIADAESGDFKRITGLLRLGVVDVVVAPFVPSNIVRALRRALRKRPE